MSNPWGIDPGEELKEDAIAAWVAQAFSRDDGIRAGCAVGCFGFDARPGVGCAQVYWRGVTVLRSSAWRKRHTNALRYRKFTGSTEYQQEMVRKVCVELNRQSDVHRIPSALLPLVGVPVNPLQTCRILRNRITRRDQ
jgi:hypothetical protein